jgi:hypothetical protein
MPRKYRKSGYRQFVSSLGLSLVIAAAPLQASYAEDSNRIEVTVEQRKIKGDNVIRVTQGETVELVWHADEPARLHLHGYDIEFDVTPDAPTVIRLTAHATGRFPVTSHGFGGGHDHGHATLLYLEVYPR